jgi:HPt (histidine-containing phosphotransfer) domain-containing protein
MDGLVANLEKALQEQNYTEAARIAHFIKGSTGNLRIYPIQEGALSIEKACKDPANCGHVHELIGKLKVAVQESVKGL